MNQLMSLTPRVIRKRTCFPLLCRLTLVTFPLCLGIPPGPLLLGAEPDEYPPDASVTSGNLTVTLPGRGWRKVGRSDGKIGVFRARDDEYQNLSVWPVDPNPPADTWTPAQHAKAYFNFERNQARDPGTKWTRFAETEHSINGKRYPMMTFTISREWKGAKADFEGAFLLIFSDTPSSRGRFHVVMWEQHNPKNRAKSKWAQMDEVMATLVIAGTRPGQVSIEEVRALLEQGMKKLRAGDYDGAAADFTAAIERDPKSWNAYGGRGAAKLGKQDINGALADFNRAIELNDAAIPVYFSRGHLKAGLGDRAGAISDFGKVIMLDPTHAQAHYRLANAKALAGDVPGAIQDLDRFIELSPADPSGYYSRGTLYMGSGNLAAAIADLSKAIELNPDFSDAYNNRGASRLKKGEPDAAMSDFDQTIALNPRDKMAFMNRARIKAAKKDYGRAVADYEEATRLDPKTADSFRALAWMLAVCPDASVRNGSKAVEYARKACEIDDWKRWNDLSTLAAACAESGDFDEAIKWQRKSLELAPPDKEALKERQRLELYEQGKPFHAEEKSS